MFHTYNLVRIQFKITTRNMRDKTPHGWNIVEAGRDFRSKSPLVVTSSNAPQQSVAELKFLRYSLNDQQ